MRHPRAFTLLELLVALAIVAVLAATLFPVFMRARHAAKASVCSSSFRQTLASLALYQGDYDDMHVLPRYDVVPDGAASGDRLWPQLVMPYLRDLRASHCPADHTHDWESEAVFDEQLVIGDNWARYYRTAERVNTGYNAVYMAPLVRVGVSVWRAMPRSAFQIESGAETLMLGDSAWSVNQDGKPSGGGHYLIIPPCRFVEGRQSDTFDLTSYRNEQIFTADLQWRRGVEFGGLYPWHNGRLTAGFADGHVRAETVAKLARGCNPLPNWNGRIFDPSVYLWDLR
jgi:prepilin-type N-terminal cleavage/methylation domain-containing protein/prepilin-type processing-associated H-X9-DG protein